MAVFWLQLRAQRRPRTSTSSLAFSHFHSFVVKKDFSMRRSLAPLLGAVVSVALAACSSSDGTDAGTDAGTDGGLTRAFTAPFTSTASEIAKSIRVTYSGESFGVDGLPYPTVDCHTFDDPYFVDGWSVFIDQYLVVLDNIRLNTGANNALQNNVGGVVATSKGGPWVMDMHTPPPPPLGLIGKDGVEPAGPLYLFTAQDNGSSFDTATKYAFSYDTVVAKSGAVNVNLTDAQVTNDFQKMVTQGWTKYVKGHATYVGTAGYAAAPGSPADIAFRAFPSTVYWSFGWDDHSSAINCNNPDFGLPEDDPQGRGVLVSPTGAAVAQMTFHVDHMFWDRTLIHGTPLRFDAVAAWATSANASASTPLELNMLGKPLAATFADGTPLPDRAPQQSAAACLDPADQPIPGQVNYPLTNGVPSSAVSNLADYMAFNTQSQAHLNADGLCYAVGQHPSDPFYAPGLPK
jgi:hypothetical protein